MLPMLMLDMLCFTGLRPVNNQYIPLVLVNWSCRVHLTRSDLRT